MLRKKTNTESETGLSIDRCPVKGAPFRFHVSFLECSDQPNGIRKFMGMMAAVVEVIVPITPFLRRLQREATTPVGASRITTPQNDSCDYLGLIHPPMREQLSGGAANRAAPPCSP